MNTLKKIFIGLGLLIAVALLTAVFVKKEYTVERSVIINQNIEEVFGFIKSLKNQEKFSKWATMDNNMKRTYTGTDGTVGFISGWSSENPDVGIGEQEIIKIIPNQRVDFELRFKEPFESNAPAFMSTELISENETKVTWGFTGNMNYPMNLMLLIMDMEEMIGNDFQTGLDKLKVVLEK